MDGHSGLEIGRQSLLQDESLHRFREIMDMCGHDDVFQKPRLWSPDVYGDRCFYYDVFVSHANGDESDELFETLSPHGILVWFDKQQVMDDGK